MILSTKHCVEAFGVHCEKAKVRLCYQGKYLHVPCYKHHFNQMHRKWDQNQQMIQGFSLQRNCVLHQWESDTLSFKPFIRVNECCLVYLVCFTPARSCMYDRKTTTLLSLSSGSQELKNQTYVGLPSYVLQIKIIFKIISVIVNFFVVEVIENFLELMNILVIQWV